MSHVIQLDDDLSHSISALAHALSAEISDDNVPSNSFENIANMSNSYFRLANKYRNHIIIFLLNNSYNSNY